MRRALVPSLLTLAVVVVACGGATDAPPPPPAMQLSFPRVTVPAGVERTQCVVKRLPNTAKVHVGAIHNVLGTASHHMVVYRVADTVERPDPFDCVPFVDALDPSKGAPLMVTQKHDDLLTLPPGVALTLEPGQMIRIELHYINAGASEVQLDATSTMVPIRDSDYHDEADFLFMGDPDIRVAAHAQYTLGPVYFPVPRELGDVKFFAITGHEHRYGTGVKIETAPDNLTPGSSVYDVPDWLWSEPKTVTYDPPFQIPDGGGFRFSCSWNNTGDTPVHFGESAEAEMCFFWAYYYPSQGSKVCIHTDQLKNGGTDMCCPGGAFCDYALAELKRLEQQ